MRPVVLVPRLVERVLPIVPGQIPGKPDQHLAQRWVHIKEERPVDVPAAHLAKVRLVPANVVRDGHIVKPGAHRQHEDRPEQDPPVAEKKIEERVDLISNVIFTFLFNFVSVYN